jgi:hypothetical protein
VYVRIRYGRRAIILAAQCASAYCALRVLEPRYNRKVIFHLTIGGVNQCTDLEEELLAFPKSPNDDTGDSAAYQVEIAQPPAGGREDAGVAETRRRLTENGAR